MSTTPQARPGPAATVVHAEDKIGRDDLSALICCHEAAYSEFIATALRGAGYKLHHASSHAAGIQRITDRSYDLTVLLENLEGCGLARNALLAHIAALQTDERRATFVVLLCQSYETGDDLAAYAHCVDLLINYRDINRFIALVGPVLEEHREANHHFRKVAARLAA